MQFYLFFIPHRRKRRVKKSGFFRQFFSVRPKRPTPSRRSTRTLQRHIGERGPQQRQGYLRWQEDRRPEEPVVRVGWQPSGFPPTLIRTPMSNLCGSNHREVSLISGSANNWKLMHEKSIKYHRYAEAENTHFVRGCISVQLTSCLTNEKSECSLAEGTDNVLLLD